MAMMKLVFCFLLSLCMANVANASNDYAVEIKQSTPLRDGKFKLQVVIKSTSTKDIKIPQEQLPWINSEFSAYYMVIVVDGVGEPYPKYSGGYPPPGITLKKGETKVEEITVHSKLLAGKDAKKTLIKFIWVENTKDIKKNAGVLEIF
jgi:hypothetical protein